MVSWFESAMEDSEKYIDAMSDCVPEIKDNSKTMTNADKIRAMNDSELADFLYCIEAYWDDGEYKKYIDEVTLNDSMDDILQWLQSEAE